METKISVVVPVWNREKLIERCLDSIHSQSLKPYELIVVDNNSTDSTYEVVVSWINRHKDSPIRFKLLREEKKGACAARQKGLENSEGSFISFFDSDDEMRPDLIEKASKILESRTGVDIVCWKSRIHQLDGSKRVLPFLPQSPIEGHLIHTLLRPQGYIVRKEVIERAGGWRKSIEVWNDFELGLRLLFENPVIAGIEDVLAEIYSQEDSITGLNFSSKVGKWEKTLEEMIKVNENGNHPQKEKIRKILNYRKAILGAHYYKEGNINEAQRLLQNVTQNAGFWEKRILKLSYHYTKRGWRGVWNIVRYLY